MFNSMVLALAQSNMLESKMRDAGGNNTRRMTEINTADLPTANTTPLELISTMSRTLLNADRYNALFQAYQQTSPYLGRVDGIQNLTPASTFLQSKLTRTINAYYDQQVAAINGVAAKAQAAQAAPAQAAVPPTGAQAALAAPKGSTPAIPWMP
jgi:hypothetical protein